MHIREKGCKLGEEVDGVDTRIVLEKKEKVSPEKNLGCSVKHTYLN